MNLETLTTAIEFTFVIMVEKIVVGLVGGNKTSQQRDIKTATKLIKDLKNNRINLN